MSVVSSIFGKKSPFNILFRTARSSLNASLRGCCNALKHTLRFGTKIKNYNITSEG